MNKLECDMILLVWLAEEHIYETKNWPKNCSLYYTCIYQLQATFDDIILEKIPFYEASVIKHTAYTCEASSSISQSTQVCVRVYALLYLSTSVSLV